MKDEFKLYIGSCLTCAKTRQTKAILRCPLKPIIYTEFNQGLSIDHLEPSKKATPRGTIALLTICDMFSKYLVCVPVKYDETEESIKVILERWILKYGVLEVIAHDL